MKHTVLVISADVLTGYDPPRVGEVVEPIEGVRVRRGDQWAAAMSDGDRVAESTDPEGAQLLVEACRDRTAAWRKEPA